MGRLVLVWFGLAGLGWIGLIWVGLAGRDGAGCSPIQPASHQAEYSPALMASTWPWTSAPKVESVRQLVAEQYLEACTRACPEWRRPNRKERPPHHSPQLPTALLPMQPPNPILPQSTTHLPAASLPTRTHNHRHHQQPVAHLSPSQVSLNMLL